MESHLASEGMSTMKTTMNLINDPYLRQQRTLAVSIPTDHLCHSILKRDVFSLRAETARDLRLDQYLSINTSEDNISFEQIMEETEKKERTKVHQAWLYKQQALTHSVRSLFNSLNRNANTRFVFR